MEVKTMSGDDCLLTEEDFFDTVECEGGILEAIFSYGIKPSDIEPGEVRDLVKEISSVEPFLQRLLDKSNAYFSKGLDYER
jgi:hypothetical protein